MKTTVIVDGGRVYKQAVGRAEHTGTQVQAGLAAPLPLWIALLRGLLRVVFKLLFRIRIEGRENMPTQPAIICPNHLGWVETFLVLLFLPQSPRIYVIGKEHVKYLSGFRTWLIDRLQIMVSIDPTKAFKALRIAEDLIARGGSLLIFPEGALGSVEGALLPLQPGAAHASITAGVPIIPVGISGSKELWLRRTLTLRVGPALHPAQFSGDTRSRVRSLTLALDGSLRTLLPGDREQPRVKLLRDWLTDLF